MARHWGWLLVFAIFAGCTSSSPPRAAIETDAGALHGVVVDDAIRPVAGATVDLPTLSRNTTSAVDGSFRFDRLPPGALALSITKAGYIGATLTADIGDDETPPLHVVLERAPTTLPYVVSYSFDGFIECGLANFAACGIPNGESGMACELTGICAGNVTNDRFIVMYGVEGVPDWIQAELAWETTQPLGDSMDLTMFAATEAERAAHGGRIISDTYGTSPVLGTINGTTARLAGIGSNSSLVIGTYGGPYGGSYPCVAGQCVTVIGLVVEQRFRVYTNLFYHYVPPEGWLFTSEGTVPSPPTP